MEYSWLIIDVSDLNAGQDYGKLKRLYIIFICDYDPYKKGRSIYRFSKIPDSQNSGAFLDLDVNYIVLNARGLRDNINVDLDSFLDLVAGKNPMTDFAEKINAALEKTAKLNKGGNMKYEADLVNERYLGIDEGFEKGYNEGQQDGYNHGQQEAYAKANLEFARYLISEDKTYEEIKKYIPLLSKEEYEKLKNE